MSESWGKALLRAWPVVTLGLLAVVFVLMLTFSRKAPVIASLDPAMAAPGQQVILQGDYFGRTEREGSLSLAGEIPPPSLIQSWSDQRIVFTVPEDARSGLVTVSNSQGTSTGVLFTNTRSIPTVLQAASSPSTPLVTAIVPPQPASGQVVTLLGRGFGSGDRPTTVRVSTGEGPVFTFGLAEAQSWADRAISFRWPTGAGAESSVQIVASGFETPAFPVSASTPVVYESPRSIKAVIKMSATSPSGKAFALWGPVPQAATGTVWRLESAQPTPLASRHPLVFRWSPGLGGERVATYTLTLTTWARRWEGFSSGLVAAEAPMGDDRPQLWWKPAQSALKVLVAKWGLEGGDPWLRLQRLHEGLSKAFVVQSGGGFALTRTPDDILASGRLVGIEAASLGAALAAQARLPSRLVSGLGLEDKLLVPRVWTEVWLAGAGWIPWDLASGSPGTLDNGHFAFSIGRTPSERLEPDARTFGAPAPWGQGEPAGETNWADAEPVVRWEITLAEK